MEINAKDIIKKMLNEVDVYKPGDKGGRIVFSPDVTSAEVLKKTKSLDFNLKESYLNEKIWDDIKQFPSKMWEKIKDFPAYLKMRWETFMNRKHAKTKLNKVIAMFFYKMETEKKIPLIQGYTINENLTGYYGEEEDIQTKGYKGIKPEKSIGITLYGIDDVILHALGKRLCLVFRQLSVAIESFNSGEIYFLNFDPKSNDYELESKKKKFDRTKATEEFEKETGIKKDKEEDIEKDDDIEIAV